ncbi:MAG: hypothetical protein WCR82_00970 [Bacteroidales bacterium]
MKRFVIFIFSALMLLNGCQSYTKLEVKSFEIEKIDKLSYVENEVEVEVDVLAFINNPTCSKYTLKSMNATVYSKNQVEIAKVISLGKSVVLPRSSMKTLFKMKVSLKNPLSFLLSGSFNFDALSKETLTVDVDMVLNNGIFNKIIKKRGIPLDKIIKEVEILKGGDK